MRCCRLLPGTNSYSCSSLRWTWDPEGRCAPRAPSCLWHDWAPASPRAALQSVSKVPRELKGDSYPLLKLYQHLLQHSDLHFSTHACSRSSWELTTKPRLKAGIPCSISAVIKTVLTAHHTLACPVSQQQPVPVPHREELLYPSTTYARTFSSSFRTTPQLHDYTSLISRETATTGQDSLVSYG